MMKLDKSFLVSLLILSVIFLVINSCAPKGELPTEEEEMEETIEEEETEPPAKAMPKMTEALYVDLAARSALIWDKYKDESEKAQQEVDNLYFKAGVTWKDYQEFEAKLTPQERDALQKKIMDYMQKIIHEYR